MLLRGIICSVAFNKNPNNVLSKQNWSFVIFYISMCICRSQNISGYIREAGARMLANITCRMEHDQIFFKRM